MEASIMKTFTVRTYYSGYCTRSVKAKDEDAAIEKARSLNLNEEAKNEILSNLEPWEDADEAEEE